MASDDNYDLVPHSELHKLEDEIDELKKDPKSAPTSMGQSMDDLSKSLKSMISIFKEAKDELRIEDEEKELLSKKIDPMINKLDNLLDQNEKIAEGILSLADMIKKLEAKVDSAGSQKGPDLLRSSAPPRSSSQPQQPTFPSMLPPQQQPAQSPQFPPQQPPIQPPQQPSIQPPQQPPMGGAPPQDLLTDSLGPSPKPPQEPPQLQPSQQPSAPPGQEQATQGGLSMPPPPPPNPGKKKGFFG